jgi:hypothetical protein
MEHLVCSSVKELMVDYLRSMTEASQEDGDCVVTLPISTFDQRWVDVSIQQRSPGNFVVDDSGKAWDELFAQGVAMTEVTSAKFASIANRFGVEFVKGRFRVICNHEYLQHSIWTIGQCSSLAMSELISHRPSVEKDLKKAVGGIITDWGIGAGFRVQPDRMAVGKTAEHIFDFVASDTGRVIAVNILAPGSGGLARAKQYGFQSFDLDSSPEAHWKKMAVLSRPEEWSYDARALVKRFAQSVVDFHNRQNDLEPIQKSLEELKKAA